MKLKDLENMKRCEKCNAPASLVYQRVRIAPSKLEVLFYGRCAKHKPKKVKAKK